MAFITLAGTLRDPTSELAVGDQIRFTHKSTTGETVEGAVSVLTIDPSGTYSKDLQYGLVLVEYKDVRTSQFKNLGVATVNGSNPATSIPELLNALVPVSSAELIEFQAILADAVTAKNESVIARNEAEAFANSIDLINDLSQAYIFDTVAEYKASTITFPVGKTVHLNDRGADFLVVAGTGTATEFKVIASSVSNQSIDLITNGVFIPMQWGIDITGIIDSTLAYNAVVSAANTAKSPLTCSSDIINVGTDVSAPDYGFKGGAKITNGGLTLTRKRKTFDQSAGKLEIDDTQANTFHVNGSQYGKFSNIDNSLEGGFLIDGHAADFGTFWNSFDDCIGDILIDIGDTVGQAVNQNTFTNHRGGVHVYGDKATVLQQFDNNVFYNIDTTLADFTDASGVSGWHILNDSVDNSNNLLIGVYMEGSGKRAIKGNWSTIKVYSDGVGSPYATPPTCHHIMNGDHNTRNKNDHFSANPQSNLCIGGLWDVLNADDKGQPKCLSDSNVTDSVVADNTIPMGFTHKYGGTSTVDFSLLKVALSKSFSGAYGVCILIQNVQGNISMQFENDGDAKSVGGDVYHDLGNNWRLYRLSSVVRNDGNDDQLTIFFRVLGGTGENYIAGVWGTPQKTSFMPGPVPDVNRFAVTTSASSSVNIVPIGLPVGGRIKNINAALTTGNTVEWVKRADNTAQPIIIMP